MMDDGKIESRARLAGLERREEGGTGLDGLGAVRWSEKETGRRRRRGAAGR